jgi:hypothetical protein
VIPRSMNSLWMETAESCWRKLQILMATCVMAMHQYPYSATMYEKIGSAHHLITQPICDHTRTFKTH